MVETLEQAELCTLPLNTSCTSTPVSPKVTLIKTLLYCIALLTVTLNLLVVISICYFRQLHTSTNVFLLSLAVSDLLVGLALMPTSVATLQSCWFLDKITCALWILLSSILTSSSVGNMVLISVDRYVAICTPLHYSSIITQRRAKICVSLCWICSVIYNFTIAKDFLLQIDMLKFCSQECTFIISYISGAVDFILTFFCPVTVIIVLYMRVFVVAVSQARVMRSQIVAAKSRTLTVVVKKSEMRAARTLGIVLLVFILCLCPYYCPFLAGQDITDDGSSPEVWLFCCNSTLNPLIYAFFYPWFRKAIKLIVSLQILQPGSREAKIMQLHTSTNVFLLSLAVSDLFVGLAMMPAAMALHSCWFLDEITCALSFMLTFILTSSSVGSMVLISVDRYVAIYNFIILKDHLLQIDMLNPCPQECTLIISYISGSVDFILTFFSPVTVIIVLYMRVFVVAVSQARVMRSQIVADKSRTLIVVVKKSEMRAARTLGIVLLVFILCLCPYYCPSLAGQDNTIDGSFAQLWLFFCNSSLNPLIYAFFYPWFRKSIKLIVSLQILQPGSCEAKIM